MIGEKELGFSQKVKKEIAGRTIQNPCCVQAACYGVACFSKYFDAKGVVLHTERAYIAQWAKAMFAAAGIAGKVYVRGGVGIYEFSVKEPYEVEKMLALFSHTGDETALRIQRDNFSCTGCFSAFLAAAFMCSGTLVNPEKHYQLEFVSGKYLMMQDFESLLVNHSFKPRRVQRNGSNVVYFKSSEQIEDLLTTMSASNCALEIMNLKVYKDLRNRANRVTNCETANIDKIVAANRKVLEAINLLEQAQAVEALPPPLRDAIELRKKYPDLSLADLAKQSEEPVSKSGLSHRYKKICEKAEEIQKNSK